jgi:hypothetical protein
LLLTIPHEVRILISFSLIYADTQTVDLLPEHVSNAYGPSLDPISAAMSPLSLLQHEGDLCIVNLVEMTSEDLFQYDRHLDHLLVFLLFCI